MNRIVLISGASRGLGLSLVQKFVSSGDTVYGVSRSKKYWSDIPDELFDSGRFILETIELADESRVQSWIKNVLKRAKRIDLVINNAGYASFLEPVHKIKSRELQKSFELNLFTAFHVCKHVLPVFQKQKHGLIMNVSSMAGTRAVPKLFSYSASKFGLLALSQAIAKENPDQGISCVTVCPGGMNTEMRAALFGKEDASKQQSPDFVADLMLQIADGKIAVESGGHIVIRHGKITGIFPQPAA